MRPSFLVALVLCSSAAAQTPTRLDTAVYSGLRWREIGPFRGGRVAAVAGDPVHPLVFYMGATGGGVWKTANAGLSWEPIADSALGSGSIGAIAVAPSDPNVIYVGTGESTLRGNVSPGDGMYRSTDAGKTWSRIGLTDAGQTARIMVDPRDPDRVYVAVLGHAFGPNPTRGVFRSTDGGKTWQKVLFKSDSAGAVDVVLDPSNPRVLYAALWQAQRTPWGFTSGGRWSGLFKSTDGGDSWTDITRNKGLPGGVIGRIGVAVSPVRPELVWALVEASDGGLFRSEDAGATWTRTTDDRNLRQRAWYFSNVYADPANADVVYVLNVAFHKSVDGGKEFRPIRGSHGDHHALWIDPHDANRMVNGNDGGATVSLDGGASWSTEANQPTAQFYHVTTTTHRPYKVCGAQQDNSTVCIASRTDGAVIGEKDWYDVGGGESGYIAARPDDPDVVFAGSYGGYLSRLDVRTGQERNVNAWPENPMGWAAADLKHRFQWTFPIVLAPGNPNVLYVGSQFVLKSTDEGQHWETISPDLTRNDKSRQQASGGPITKDNTSVEYYGTVFTIAPSPKDSNLLWVGTDDGLVQLTRDGGKTWQDVTPKEITAGTQVSLVDASSLDAATAYIAATRYKLDDFTPYAFVTHDYGKTWRRITNGIRPGHFVRVVRADPERQGLLYAGTEFGVYVSFDDGANWQSLRQNLPVVPIPDLAIKDGDLIAATHGRSFWILDDLSSLRQLSPEVVAAERWLFTPGDARRGPGGGGFGGGGGRAPVGRNPAAGARIDFYFRQAPDSGTPVTLEIRDARDSLVRRFSTKPAPEGDTLRVTAGLNRFVWDLRYPGAHRFRGMVLWAGDTRGPIAVPGQYTVRLTAGSWSASRSFQVGLDPRVNVPVADLQRQFDFLVRIRDRVSAANDAVRQIRDLVQQVEGVTTRVKGQAAAAPIRTHADSLKAHLQAVEREIYQVQNRSGQDPLNFPIRINNKLAALTGVVGSADARPTDASLAVFDALDAQIKTQLDRLNAIVTSELPAFNRLVAEQNVPAVIVQ
ncbi:MAG TPA: glycosyl hydrolase [Gemmatimonadales bacterium]|nr:glycosyl hydrolase [Gemmatimonadales bacterium]